MDGNIKNIEILQDCPFCQTDENNYIIRNKYSYSILDNYPVAKGHSLIICISHTPNYFDLTKMEKYAMIDLIDETEIYLKEKYKSTGFNVGININKSAGQTVEHAHIHLIPRYENDIIDPTGGVRNVIPGKGKY